MIGLPDKAFWDTAHTTADGHWLTGSKGEHVFAVHGLTDLLRSGTRVLEVGVGLGTVTRALVNAGCEVTCVDISNRALKAVDGLASAFFSDDLFELVPRRAFDVAIHHLVAQHLHDSDLVRHIRLCCRALAPGGVLSMQIAVPLCENPTDTDGIVLRSRVAVEELFAQAGEIPDDGAPSLRYPQGIGWVFRRVRQHD